MVFCLGESLLRIRDNALQAEVAHQDRPLSRHEKDRVCLILLIQMITVVFWAAFEQGGGLITIFIAKKTDRMLWSFNVPTSWF